MLGGATVAEWQERMSSEEFNHWIACAKIRGPFSEERADIRNRMLCAMMVNVATAFAGKPGKAKPSDYMPFREKPKQKPETVAHVKEQIQVLQQVFGREAD